MPAFTHGSKGKVYGNGVDLSSYLRSASGSPAADTAETTALGDTSKKYIGGLKEGNFSAEGMFDGSASAVDSVFAAALGVDYSRFVHLPEGDGLGKFGYGYEGNETAYTVTSPVDDVCQASVEVQGCKGGERIIVLRDKASVGAGTQNGTAQDNAALTALGASAFLHVFSLTGTVDAKVQHSVDNSVWVDLITFPQVAAVAAPFSNRLGTAAGATVNRYLRAVITVATGPAVVFVGACRNPNNL